MKNFITLAFLLSLSFSAIAKTYYVTPGGKGKATSWEDASGDLNAVLFVAMPGDEVWVTAGTYFPTFTNDRNIAFVVSSGVKVYGGFKGGETAASQRDWAKNLTILSGEIGTPDAKDNSYTVIYTKNAGADTVIDGFIVEGGYANGDGEPRTAVKCGGGLFNDGSGERGRSNPQIVNCIFQNNYGKDGGAVYNNGTGGNASPTFVNCLFEKNRTDLDGGAIFNDGRRNGKSNPVFESCTFKNNEGNYGGAMINYGGAGESIPVLNACVLSGNTCYMEGPDFFNVTTEGIAYPKVYDLMSGAE